MAAPASDFLIKNILLYYRKLDLTTENCTNWKSIFSPPSVKPGGTIGLHSVTPSVCPSHWFSKVFSYMHWHIELKFCIWLPFTVLQIKFNCRQFLWELCPFWNLEYWKYAVFRTFLLHSLTFWAEILHMTLYYCTTDQVRVSSICVNFCRSYAPFGT